MEKPNIKINPSGPEGNIYAIIGKAMEALCGIILKRVTAAGSYKEAISIIEEYVTIEWKGGVPM